MVSGNSLKVEKTLRLIEPLKLGIHYQINGIFSGLFAVEFNISFFGSPYPSIIVNDKKNPIRGKGTHKGIKEFSIKDEFLNLGVGYNFDEEIDLWHYPVETISLSEKGVERIYQGTAFLFVKKCDFNDEKRLGFTIEFSHNP